MQGPAGCDLEVTVIMTTDYSVIGTACMSPTYANRCLNIHVPAGCLTCVCVGVCVCKTLHYGG